MSFGIWSVDVVDKFFYPISQNYERCDDFESECGHSVPVYEIRGLHALIQLYGYAKFKFRETGQVVLRGQGELYSRCLPSYFRKKARKMPCRARNKFGELRKDLAQLPCFKSVPEFSIEPLVQHYGIETTWLDVVDNVWVALWFGLNEFRQKKATNYISYQPREEVDGKGRPQYLYLLFFLADCQKMDDGKPGCFYR